MNDKAGGIYSNHCAVKGTGDNKMLKKKKNLTDKCKLPTYKQNPNCIHRKKRQFTPDRKVPLAIS